MLSRQRFDEAAFRLVDYHLVLLKEIKEDFQQGRLQKQQDFEKYWSQIKQSHQFMTERLAHDSLAADYCIQYVLTSYEFLYAWRDLNETLSWVEIGIKASQQLDNQQMIALMNYQISLYFTSRQLTLAHEKIELLFANEEKSQANSTMQFQGDDW